MLSILNNIFSVNRHNFCSLGMIFFFCFIFLLRLYGQPYDYRFEFFADDQGLRGSPHYLYQDSHGFIWIGTWYGLYRYDGYEFELFRHDSNDSTTLSNENINCIVEDSSGNLWVGTQNGLNKFNPFLGKSVRFYHDSTYAASLSNSYITALFIDTDNTLWIGTRQGGLNKMVIHTDRTSKKSQINFQQFLAKPEDSYSISNNHINAIFENSQTTDGNLLIGTANGLNIFNKKTGKFKRYLNDKENSNSLANNEIKCFFQDKENSVWIGASNGCISQIVQKSGSDISFNNYYLGIKGQITDIEEDADGNLWIGAFLYGLYSFNKETRTFFRVPSVFNKPGFLADHDVYTLLIDRNNIMWVGTRWGLNKYDPNDKMFKYYPIDAPEDLWIVVVTGFCEGANGELWVATWGRGLFKIDSMSNKPVNYMPQENKSGSLNSRWITSILTDKKGIIWVGTDEGLVRYDPLSDSFFHYQEKLMKDDSNYLTNEFIYDLFEDRQGNLWIGTSGGLHKFDRKRKHFNHFLNNTKGEINKAGFYIGVIYEDSRGEFWIGANGLYQFDPEEGTLKKYYGISEDSSTSIDYMVFDIAEDRNGNLWVGTFGGLFCVQSNGITERFTQKDGLPSNHVYGILEDDSGFLWIATFEGLIQLDPVKKTFNSYQLQGTFLQNEFVVKGYYKAKDGRLYLGQAQRFTFFDPGDIRYNLRIPTVVIKQIKLFNNPIKFDKPISDINAVNLSHGDNMLTFDFVSLNFTNSSQNQYAYMLEGFNEDWIYCGNERYATFTNIDPGEYVFRVKASNNDGIWNEEGVSVSIIINPPLWATWWAYLLYAVFIVSLFTGATRFYLNRQRLKHQLGLEHEHAEKLGEIDQMKSRFFANISHEFRTPLTLILGPSENIITEAPSENAAKQAGIIKRNANRLLGLINQLLDLSKLEAGKLELKASKSNIVAFIKGITMSFESVAEGKDISLKVVPEKEQIESYFDKEKMTKIMTNLLSNAFKFTPDGGQIMVTINESNHNSVCIKVRDTGVGIPEDKLPKLFDRFYQVDSSHTREHEGTGIGLAFTKELVELHHGTISVDSKFGEWTEFTIGLPVGRQHLKDEEIVETEKEMTDDIIVDNEECVPSTVEEVNVNKIMDEDKNILLVVEDNADVRDYIKDSLGDEFQIEEASNGEQGVRKAEKIIPDLIISDIMMPKMDGNELTRILKKDEKTSHIPIILLTAKSLQESKLEGLEAGADDYLTKPFDTKELQIRIKNLIKIRRKLQNKYGKGDYVPTKKEEAKKLSSLEEQFMSKVLEVIEEHISEEEFSIEQFGKEVGMSRVQLHRKLKALSGKSASHYLRSVRLSKARQLIEEQRGNISEIAYSVGFSSPQYFTRCFKEEFGFPPSDLAK